MSARQEISCSNIPPCLKRPGAPSLAMLYKGASTRSNLVMVLATTCCGDCYVALLDLPNMPQNWQATNCPGRM